MSIKKSELGHALKIMKTTGQCIPESIIKDLTAIYENPNTKDVIELVDTHPYFATMFWSDDDIKTKLEDLNYETCDENIEMVKSRLNISNFTDATHGFELIYNAITKCKNLIPIQTITEEEQTKVIAAQTVLCRFCNKMAKEDNCTNCPVTKLSETAKNTKIKE